MKIFVYRYSVCLTFSAVRIISFSSVKVSYRVYWNCPQCYHSYYYKAEGSAVVYVTNYRIRRLQTGKTYVFSVHAENSFGTGKNATTSTQYTYNFWQVKNLRAIVGSHYTMTVQWKPPTGIDPEELKVCPIFISLEV